MSFEIREKTEKKPQRAVLIGIGLPGEIGRDRFALLAELVDLVTNLGYGIAESRVVWTRELQAKYLCGIGKAEEIQSIAAQYNADCLVLDNMLSPSQQREWEELVGVPVKDREEIILDIFAQRARTREAVMQVDLARMQYALPRMAGMWQHLDRQRGGSGGGKGGGAAARGEGEKQIEVDRRLARERIEMIRRDLKQVRQQRATQRKERIRHGIPTAAIVGYTNAGKSSLLNVLTNAGVLAQDILFATLDTTSRKIELPDGQSLVLTDTVGFIRNLPYRLVEAFKSTLEEAVMADLLVHVVDASDADAPQHYATTCAVLEDLNVGEKPVILVGNKLDQIRDEERDGVLSRLREVAGNAPFVPMSVARGEGVQELLSECVKILAHRMQIATYRIPQAEARLLAIMHRDGKVESVEYEGNNIVVRATLPKEFAARIESYREI